MVPAHICKKHTPTIWSTGHGLTAYPGPNVYPFTKSEENSWAFHKFPTDKNIETTTELYILFLTDFLLVILVKVGSDHPNRIFWNNNSKYFTFYMLILSPNCVTALRDAAEKLKIIALPNCCKEAYVAMSLH